MDGARQHRNPRDVNEAVADALQVRLPRIPPISFNGQDALDAALERVGELFQQASGELEDFGFTCRVRTSDSAVMVRVEERGRPVCELRLRHGNDVWSEQLTVSFAWPQITGDGVNGFVTSEWDADARQARLKYDDYSRDTPSFVRSLITADELFHKLWEKIVRHLEQRIR